MPGLIAILTHPNIPDLSDMLERTLSRMASPGDRTVRVVLPDWGVAFGHTGPSRAMAQQPGVAANGQVMVLVEGEPLETGALGEQLGLPASASPAEAIAALYAAQGAGALTQLRGHWAIAVVDTHLRQIVLANDAFGIRPLYRLRADDGAWLIASHPAAILAYPAVTRAVDPAGLADFLAFGYPLGSKTLFRGMELLPGATLLTWKEDAMQTRRYWRLAPQPARALDEHLLESVRTAFNESVGRMAKAGGHPVGLALTGGLDSRAILSAMLVNGVSPQTITHSVPGAHDALYGAAAAQAAGVPHHFLEVRGEDLTPHIRPAIALQGGQTTLIDAHPLSLLPDFVRLSPVWFTGMGGDLLQRGTVFQAQNLSQVPNLAMLKKWALEHHNRIVRVDTDFPALFSPDWLAEWQGQPIRSLEEAFAAMDPGLPPTEMSCIFYLEELARKFLTKGDRIIRTKLETRHPYLDRDVLQRGFGLPMSTRASYTAHRFIITHNAPALTEVPMAKTGLPLGRYPFTRQERWIARMSRTPWPAATYPFALWDRLENRNRRKREASGRQARHTLTPDYRYADWLRAPLRPMVEAVLLDPRTLSRPYFQPETLRRWVDEHMAGQDHTEKLGALISLELTLRALIED